MNIDELVKQFSLSAAEADRLRLIAAAFGEYRRDEEIDRELSGILFDRNPNQYDGTRSPLPV